MSESTDPRRTGNRREPSRLPGVGDTPEEQRRELREEMEAHMAHRVDDLVASGISEEEARRQAQAEFGDPTRYQEEIRRTDTRLRRRRGSRWR